jgi:hypothetical protein
MKRISQHLIVVLKHNLLAYLFIKSILFGTRPIS